MAENTWWQTIKLEGGSIAEKIKHLIHEGNVRRIVIGHEGRTIAEFPLTAGVVGALLAPVVASIGAIVALVKDCTIQVEREGGSAGVGDEPGAAHEPGTGAERG